MKETDRKHMLAIGFWQQIRPVREYLSVLDIGRSHGFGVMAEAGKNK